MEGTRHPGAGVTIEHVNSVTRLWLKFVIPERRKQKGREDKIKYFWISPSFLGSQSNSRVAGTERMVHRSEFSRWKSTKVGGPVPCHRSDDH